MNLPAHLLIGLILIIVVSLSAFGIALAVTVFQTSRQVPSALIFSEVEVLSSSDLGLYHDREAAIPATSLQFTALNLQPPLIPRVPDETVYIRNESDPGIELTLIEPCREVRDAVSGSRIGFMNPQIFDIGGQHRGDVCEGQRLAPGEMVRALVNIHDLEPGLQPGEYPFTAVFGAVGSDVPSDVHLVSQADCGDNQTCYSVSVDCSGLTPREVQIRVNHLVVSKGAVVFTTGGWGSRLYGGEPGSDGPPAQIVERMRAEGYETYEVSWTGERGWGTENFGQGFK